MSITIASIETRIKEYEAEIVKIVATHSSLMGGLNELKQLLTLVSPVIDTLAPAAEPVLNIANEVVDGLDSIASPVASDTI